MYGVEILLHVVFSGVVSCLCVFALLRARGVRGLRALHRDLLDLQADYAAMARRLKKMQTSYAGEASADAKKSMHKDTIDFMQAQGLKGSAGEQALGQ